MRLALDTRLVDTTDSSVVHDFRQFLQNLDPDSYAKRFSDLPVESNLETIREFNWIFAYADGKVVGVADYSTDLAYKAGTVANVNIVVDAKYQGRGIGKALIEAREGQLRKEQYLYKVGGVYRENEAQIQRLLRHGWRETTESAQGQDDDLRNDDLRIFWKAIDANYKEQEPIEERD